MSNRVVITGIGFASPIGHDLDTVSSALTNDRHGIVTMTDWGFADQLQTRLAGRIDDLELERAGTARRCARWAALRCWPRSPPSGRSQSAGIGEDYLASGKVGLAYGSTHGSSTEVEDYCGKLFRNGSLKGLASSAYLKFMSHTCAANLAQFYGIKGRVITTCAACVSASQAIGYGYEAVKHGIMESMVCGGAEELHFIHAGVFDIMFATSTKYNDRPELSPRPFDEGRDGLVVAEGAGTLVLESYERAKARTHPSSPRSSASAPTATARTSPRRRCRA